MSLKRKIFIVLLIGTFLGIILWYKFYFEPGFDLLLGGDVKATQNIVPTSLGDSFLIKDETRNFPDISTSFEVMDYPGEKEMLIYFVVEDNTSYYPEFIPVIDTSRIRCYQIDQNSDMLIYKVGNNKFKGVHLDRLTKYELSEYREFVEVARALVAKKEWKWIKVCAEFLVQSGDVDMIKILERYARGEFSQEELRINRNSGITQEDMKAFSEKTLVDNK